MNLTTQVRITTSEPAGMLVKQLRNENYPKCHLVSNYFPVLQRLKDVSSGQGYCFMDKSSVFPFVVAQTI